jgi:hypothetical protein
MPHAVILNSPEPVVLNAQYAVILNEVKDPCICWNPTARSRQAALASRHIANAIAASSGKR